MAGKKLFDWIAPVYGLFFAFQKRMYRRTLQNTAPFLPLDRWKTVLDVGCGTGAFLAVMLEQGFHVTGIDTSEKMLAVAKRRVKHPHARFVTGDGKSLPFADASFDIVFSSYVLHGMPRKQRLALYQEINRVAKHRVIIHDYNQVRSRLTDVVEWAEGGDYFHFIQVAEGEMGQVFPNFRVVPADKKAHWYVGQKTE